MTDDTYFFRPRPKRLTVSIPERAGPHVKLAFAEMARQGINYDDMAWKSGVMRATLKAWRVKNYPTLQNLEAVLGVLGFDLVPVPRAAVLPPDLVRELQPIADRFGLSMASTIQAIVEIVAGVHEKFDPGSRSPDRMAA